MYLPRSLISHLYTHLLRTHHQLSPPVLLLVSLDPDALCACRILTSLFKRDYIPHKIQPISGYGDLAKAGEKLVRPMRTTDGGSGGVVVCLGVGGLVDLESILGLEVDESGYGGMGDVDIWVIDARRPWNLSNVFGVPGKPSVESEGQPVTKTDGIERGMITQTYQPGRGGVIVFDDGDIEDELGAEREAYCTLAEMPELGYDDEDEEQLDNSDASDSELDVDERMPESGQAPRKRKSSPDFGEDSESDDPDEGTPRKRRRSNSSSPVPVTPERRPARRDLLINGPPSDSSVIRSDPPSTTLPGSPSSKQPSARKLRRELLKLRRKHDAVLRGYYSLGTSYSEPISSLMYSLASELGREDNDLLWHAIVGVSSLELTGRTSNGLGLSPLSTSGGSSGWSRDRGEHIRAVLRDEVRRLNPVDPKDLTREANVGEASGVIPTHARSPTDNSIRLSPEPRFLLIRHWSLYDSMLHSPYLSAKLHIWSDAGRRRLHKLLAKMGVSLAQCRQSYTHMDMELKRSLRERLLKFAPIYGLEGLVPPPASKGEGRDGWGFVRCWGWKACLSAVDVGVVVGAILEVGDMEAPASSTNGLAPQASGPGHTRHSSTSQPSQASAAAELSAVGAAAAIDARRDDALTTRFWTAYDALASIALLTGHMATAQHLHRAILRTGTSLIEKKQIRHLRAFRMAVVKEGPDVALFTHPGALTKLALWVAEAIAEMEGGKGRKGGELVMAGLDEERGVYVVVGLGGGAGVLAAKEREKRRAERKKEREKRKEERKAERERQKKLRRERLEALGEEWDSGNEEFEDETESEEESEDEDDEQVEKGKGRNRFGNAFQEVIEETGARVKVDSFEHCVVEVKKEDLSGFLESLSMKAVVG